MYFFNRSCDLSSAIAQETGSSNTIVGLNTLLPGHRVGWKLRKILIFKILNADYSVFISKIYVSLAPENKGRFITKSIFLPVK